MAILGDNPVVSQALTLLLWGSGYDTTLIEANPVGLADGLLDCTDLLLLAPVLTNSARNTLLSIVRGNPRTTHTPVLTLPTAMGDVLDAKSGTLLVPWPSPVAVLAQQIEAILDSDTKEEGRGSSGSLKELSHSPC